MLWKVAVFFAAFGWILLLLVDDLVGKAAPSKAEFEAASRRYPTVLFVAAAVPPIVLGPLCGMPLGAVLAGAGGGFMGGMVAMALNRLAGRWWRLCLRACLAAVVVLVGYSLLAI